MGTFTAQILIGTPHNFHDGISPSHVMYLSENDRPAWLLLRHDPLEPQATERIATWIPTVDHMLEDGLMMIAAHVADAVTVREALGDSKTEGSAIVSLTTELTENQLHSAREAARTCSFGKLKLVVTVLPESTVMEQTSALERYSVTSVVCVAGHG